MSALDSSVYLGNAGTSFRLIIAFSIFRNRFSSIVGDSKARGPVEAERVSHSERRAEGGGWRQW